MSVWIRIRIRVPGLLSLLIPYCSKLYQPLWFSPVSSHFHRCWFRQVPRCLPCCWFSPVSNLLHHPAPSQLCCPATSHLHIAIGFAQLSSQNIVDGPTQMPSCFSASPPLSHFSPSAYPVVSPCCMDLPWASQSSAPSWSVDPSVAPQASKPQTPLAPPWFVIP